MSEPINFKRIMIAKNVMERFDLIYPPPQGLSRIEAWQMSDLLRTCDEITPQTSAMLREHPLIKGEYRCFVLPDRRGIFDIAKPFEPMARYDHLAIRFWAVTARQGLNIKRNLGQSAFDMNSLLTRLFQESYNAKCQYLSGHGAA